jgi:hypothetical protein
MAALTYRDTTVNPIWSRRAIWLAVAALGLGGCGGDDEKSATTSQATDAQTAPDTVEGRVGTPPDGSLETEPAPTSSHATSPEAEPGGAGDEEPAHSLALLTGRDGRITPRRVRVPAFISIRVELKSGDGRSYALSFGRRMLSAGGDIASVSSRFAGLRPGAALVGRPVNGAGNVVRIEATAEPGP